MSVAPDVEIPDDPRPAKSRWYTSLFVQLLIAIVAGIAVGWLWPGVGADLKPLDDETEPEPQKEVVATGS